MVNIATKARLKANNNWRKKNPFKARKISYKSTSHTYINKYANHKDLIDLKNLINHKLNEK